MPNGYMGKLLNVDLTTGSLGDEPLDLNLARSFVGGYGLGARLLYDRVPRGADPLGPDNVLGLVTGPLTGTPTPMGSRYCAVGKSPLTGGWGDANSGGEWGPALKFAGYDAVLIRGISPEPLYLLIAEGHAELRPAAELWGRDCTETEQALQARHGKGLRVASIGPAGERLVRFACIINDRGRAAGRSGLGAVMGSKRLKAVVAGGDLTPAVAAPDEVKALRAKYLPLYKHEGARLMHRYGTTAYTKALIELGRTPIKNWSGSSPADYPRAEAVDGPALAEFEVKKYACWHCNLGCGGIVRWQSEGQTWEGHRPEYETLASLGAYCQIDDLQAIMDMNEICNRAGLDTISAGGVLAFAIECAENGLLSSVELDGLELRWGNAQAAKALLRRIVQRQGLGDLLAEGVARASQQVGRGSEAFAMHAGGQELPAHDPRHAPEFGLAYQLSPTPGRHTQGGAGVLDQSPEQQAALGLDPSLAGVEQLHYHAQACAALARWWHVVNAAGLCAQHAYAERFEFVPEFLSAVTGWEFDMPECLRTGERIEVMRLLFSLREGMNPLQVQLPGRALGRPPLEAGPTAGRTVDVDGLRAEYLALLGWDPVTALPERARLAALGLTGLALDWAGP
jgi:aldehyde:ferredoxin oxidoreductase